MKDNFTDIWQGVLSKNPKAWNLLVTKFTPLLFAITRRYRLTQSQSEDIIQQAWIDLYKSRNAIRDSQKVRSWLTSVVNRKSARFIKKLIKDKKNNLEYKITSDVNLPDEEIILLEQHYCLKQAMGQLDERCNTVLTAIFTAPSNRTYKDIARSLGIPLNSLSPTRMRCLKRLKVIYFKLDK